MSNQPVIVCDGPNCGQVKGSTNHWYAVMPRQDKFAAFIAYRFDETPENILPMLKHVCSRACAQKLFESWMEGKAA